MPTFLLVSQRRTQLHPGLVIQYDSGPVILQNVIGVQQMKHCLNILQVHMNQIVDLRPCLKNVNMPKQRAFFRLGGTIFP